MKLLTNFKYLLLMLMQLFVAQNECAKILAIFPFPGPSQYMLVQPYLKTLAAKGHEVTAISAFPQKTPVENFRDIEVPEVLKYVGDMLAYASGATVNKFFEIFSFGWYYSTICKDVLHNPNVQLLLKSKEEHFDLVIVETLQTDVLFGFAEHFQAPLIGVSSYGTDPYIDALVDNISPLAYTPLYTGTATERMNFRQRLENMWHNLLMLTHRVLMHYPLHDNLYQEYFPNASRSLEQLRQNFSIILLNQHFSASFPRSYVPNMIEVGGFHIQHKPQALPTDIAEFMSASNKGVIYFSMGSNIKSEHFPAATRKMFLEIFAQLPYQVLWKFENPALIERKPANVLISKWFPQADILAHPQLKLFITHGGLLSQIETIYHGKPVLCIPVFFDQILNSIRAEQSGYGLFIEYLQLNRTVLADTINEMMENSQYAEKANVMSRRYRDQPMDPLEKAIYWTEYVLRHQGAEFLRSPAQHLNFWQQQSWDCAAVIGAAFLLSFTVVIFILVKIFKLLAYLCKSKKAKAKKH